MAYQAFTTRIKWLVRSFKRSPIKYDHAVLIILASLIGIVVGYLAISFHKAISYISEISFNSASVLANDIPAWRIILVPILGGVIVAFLLRYLTADKKAGGVADVMEANALRDGKISLKYGASSILITAISLGTGASAGREGPVVHMGATLASWVSERLSLTAPIGRTLLACGVSSAVAASFNAPIAGVFFALEVVIGHYAINTFAPVVIASVAGTIVSRAYLGDFPAFIIPDMAIKSVMEFPAFILLGVVSAIIGLIFVRSIIFCETRVEKLKIPIWLLPPIGGAIIGMMALYMPEIFGVGYEATDFALKAQYGIVFLVALLVAKTIATAVSISCRFGGGFFSPALYLGAMVGGAFGLTAAAAFPDFASSQGVYSIVGMGAVASAVLGAPISSILIIFEMTSNYSLTIAVMLAAAVSTLVFSLGKYRSIFYWQLERRGIHLSDGKANHLLRTTFAREITDKDYFTINQNTPINKVRQAFFDMDGNKLLVVNESGQLIGIIGATELSAEAYDNELSSLVLAIDICRKDPIKVTSNQSLEATLSLMDSSGEDHIPVIDESDYSIIGMVHYRDVIRMYNRALAEVMEETHSNNKK